MNIGIFSPLILLAISSSPVRAERPLMTGTPSGQILATGARRVVLMNPAGEVIWQHKGENVSDCWMQENGRVLIADNRVLEIELFDHISHVVGKAIDVGFQVRSQLLRFVQQSFKIVFGFVVERVA